MKIPNVICIIVLAIHLGETHYQDKSIRRLKRNIRVINSEFKLIKEDVEYLKNNTKANNQKVLHLTNQTNANNEEVKNLKSQTKAIHILAKSNKNITEDINEEIQEIKNATEINFTAVNEEIKNVKNESTENKNEIQTVKYTTDIKIAKINQIIDNITNSIDVDSPYLYMCGYKGSTTDGGGSTFTYDRLWIKYTNPTVSGLDISTGVFTTDTAGMYLISGSGVNVPSSPGFSMLLYLKINGGTMSESIIRSRYDAASGGGMYENFDREFPIYLAVGDTVELYWSSGSGNSLYVNFCITLVKPIVNPSSRIMDLVEFKEDKDVDKLDSLMNNTRTN